MRAFIADYVKKANNSQPHSTYGTHRFTRAR